MRVLVAALIAVCFVVGCPSAAISGMSPAGKDDYMTCIREVERSQCESTAYGSTDKVIVAATCMRPLMEKYAAAGDKKRWLVRHGCPRDMVYADAPAPAPFTKKPSVEMTEEMGARVDACLAARCSDDLRCRQAGMDSLIEHSDRPDKWLEDNCAAAH